MKKTIKLSLLLVSTALLQACIITEPVSKAELKATENSAYTSDGRLFVIGENKDKQSWIFEIKKTSTNTYYHEPYLRGTQYGTTNGYINEQASGDSCRFAGLTAQGTLLYATCIRSGGILNLGAESVSLYQVETKSGQEFVKTGLMTDENFEKSDSEIDFDPNWFMANGMAVDSNGHVYISNSKASLAPNRDAISKVIIDNKDNGKNLAFSHQTWISGAEFFPNGVQIEGDVLYYAAGSDILKTRIQADGKAGEVRLHFNGSNLATIDDFAIEQGYIAYAKLPAAGSVVILKPASFHRTARHLTTVVMPVIPSSIVYQKDLPAGNPLFDEGNLLVTSFFSGGLFRIEF